MFPNISIQSLSLFKIKKKTVKLTAIRKVSHTQDSNNLKK